MDYALHLCIMIGIYILLTLGLNLLVGFAGIVSVSQAAFYGIGAYISALLTLRLRLPFVVAFVSAGFWTGLAGLLIGRVVGRLRADYLALVTFGIGLIFYDVFNNWLSVTKGPMGLPGINQPFDSKATWLLFVVIVVAISLAFITLISASPFGRLLRAIRDDEELATVLGRNTRNYKATAFMISAALAGMAGSMYAHYVTFIDPTSFTVMESVTVLAMVIIGGLTSIRGSVVGATLLVLVPEALRFIGLPSAVVAPLRQVFFGSLLVIVTLYRPQGLIKAG